MSPTTDQATSTTDPFAGLTHLADAISRAMGHLILGFFIFAIMAACICGFRASYSDSGRMAAGGVGVVAAIVGLWQVSKAFNILDDATGGFLGKLLSALISVSPLLIVLGLLWFLGMSLGVIQGATDRRVSKCWKPTTCSAPRC